VVPQLRGSYGPVIDRRPLPLAAPGQYLELDQDWIVEQSRPAGSTPEADASPSPSAPSPSTEGARA